MKKRIIIMLVLVILTFQVFANQNSSNQTTQTSSTANQSSQDKIGKGFKCLEEKVGSCTSLSVQEIALTILAGPKENTTDKCVSELLRRKRNNNWGNIRDTALAILALKHAGEETEDYENWLLTKTKYPTEIIWFLQEDSNGETECNIKYNANDYNIKIKENKKIENDAGPCLSRAQSNFWLKIAPECLNNTFVIQCNQNFIANLLYKNTDSPIIYVIQDTKSAPSFGSVEIKVSSKCFGENSCEYEATAWAILALLATGHDVREFIPYLIAASEKNKRYLPEAFIYAATNYEDYAKKLIEIQKLGNYWEAPNTEYNKFYDTSLAILSFGQSTQEQIKKAKEWLLFSQGSNGCWQNSIRDTAIVLWALEQRASRRRGGDQDNRSTIVYCNQSGYFCLPRQECSQENTLSDNFYCQGILVCCKTQNLKTCSENNGKVCSNNEVCVGIEKKATDTEKCCIGRCEQKNERGNECEEMGYVCKDSCLEYQEEVSYSCSGQGVCCRSKTQETKSSKLWIWILIILIIIVLGAIIYLKREDIKLFLFKMKARFKKEKDSNKSGLPPTFGPRGPPQRPALPPRAPPTQPIRRIQNQEKKQTQKDPEMEETFRKLREIAKK